MIQNVFVIILDTSTVLGINMECLEQELGIYNITCEEIGANRTGCRNKLTGRNTAIVQGNAMGDDHDLKYIARIEDYNHITVYDSSNKDVISKPFNYTWMLSPVPPKKWVRNYYHRSFHYYAY